MTDKRPQTIQFFLPQGEPRVVISGMEFYCYGPDGEKEFTTFMA